MKKKGDIITMTVEEMEILVLAKPDSDSAHVKKVKELVGFIIGGARIAKALNLPAEEAIKAVCLQLIANAKLYPTDFDLTI